MFPKFTRWTLDTGLANKASSTHTPLVYHNRCDMSGVSAPRNI